MLLFRNKNVNVVLQRFKIISLSNLSTLSVPDKCDSRRVVRNNLDIYAFFKKQTLQKRRLFQFSNCTLSIYMFSLGFPPGFLLLKSVVFYAVFCRQIFALLIYVEI